MTRRIRGIWAVGLVLGAVGAVSGTKAAAPQGRFTVSTDTVLDTETGLTWQRTDDGRYRNWDSAKTYCLGLPLAGGWRLPTVKELLTIVDFSRISPAADTTIFGAASEFYWASSAVSGSSGYAWYVYFNFGYTTSFDVGYNRVRCVR